MLRYLIKAAIFSSLLPLAAQATPFAEPGDPGLRQDIQYLVDRGCARNPVTTWPLMWGGLNLTDSPDCRPLARMVNQRRAAALRYGGRASIDLNGASQPPVLSGFDDQPREELEVGLALGWQGQATAGRLSGYWVDDATDDRQWRLDGSYLLGRAGNWALGAAAIDRWWGPGWHSSLILSDNARPVPGLWLNRNQTHAPDSRWLAWVGPWSLTLFAGQLESDRGVPEAKFLGGRLVFRPLESLEVGLSRAAQWGGEGRPEDFDSFLNMLAGKDNGQSSGLAPGEDPANQRAGLDFRWGGGIGDDQTASLYAQAIGEDEAGGLPSKHTWLAGIDWQAGNPWGRHLLYLEGTDTTAGSLSGENRFNTAFEHGTYVSGWRYYGRNLASTWGADGRVVSLGLKQRLQGRETVDVTVSRASFNRDGKIRPSQAANPVEPTADQTLWLLEGGYSRPLLGGSLSINLSWASERVPAVTGREQGTLALGWERKWTF